MDHSLILLLEEDHSDARRHNIVSASTNIPLGLIACCKSFLQLVSTVCPCYDSGNPVNPGGIRTVGAQATFNSHLRSSRVQRTVTTIPALYSNLHTSGSWKTPKIMNRQ